MITQDFLTLHFFSIMSLVTSVKDYVEITHKVISIEPLKNYTEFGAVFTYFIFSIGDFFKNFFSFSLFKNIWSIPIIVPDIASAMISEISVLDGYFHNAFTFLETNVNTATNPSLVIFEKFIIGLINSFFLFLPTSTSHLITLRRFVMQGLEAGYLAGLGTLAGNFLWLASIILGWRFFVIPWLSLDIFRYLLGFILLVKYIWDSSKERRMALEDLSKWKIFLLNFLLALTEQSCIYPFITNLSIGPETSILEGFPVENYAQFLTVHGAYLFGILLGSFSLLQFTCWFWENPAFSIYLWITTKSSLKISTSSYYKILNYTFLYCTMLCAIASIPYYGLDYTITNPIGLVPQDRVLDQKKSQSDPDKLITETSFLGVNSTDKNSRIRDGVHARRERWKQRLIKYQAFDASTYDQGVYDFLTIEDLNYGFDRFWLRRKMRNHQIRFRLFPGPWMRTLKKQLNNPSNQSLENSNKAASGPRVEFFRILFEQFYHPNFHNRSNFASSMLKNEPKSINNNSNTLPLNVTSLPSLGLHAQHINNQKNNNALFQQNNLTGSSNYILNSTNNKLITKPGLIYSKQKEQSFQSNSALRKFVRNVNTRINLKLVTNQQHNLINKYNSKYIYSKRWKSIFAKIQPITKTSKRKSYYLFRNVAKQFLTDKSSSPNLTSKNFQIEKLSQQERKLLNLRTNFILNLNNLSSTNSINNFGANLTIRPLNIYLQKEQAFKRKLRYYGATPMRKLTVGNQAPYLKALMKRGFYYYKPTLRWKKTLYVASMRRGFRKKSRKQRVLMLKKSDNTNIMTNTSTQEKGMTTIVPPTHSYTVLGKRASRYRHQIYKDVLQHWYYTPFNRLLLKFDVDAFINRQPKSHFLTKNEERLLHIRRFLLSEHYDTLRWYTSMQHYRTMKTNIGGTKSFASRPYNQQFQGTFKKVRHLFAITPKQGDLYTLKFDQPLYNDNKIKDSVYFHEELLAENTALTNSLVEPRASASNNLSPSFINSTNINSQIVLDSKFIFNSVPQESEKANALLMSISNQKISNNLNKNLDLINQSNLLIGQQLLNTNTNKYNELLHTTTSDFNNISYSELFIKLIKECKKRIQDQTFLKNYITHRIEKRDQLNQENLSSLAKRLEKLKIWYNAEKNIPTKDNKLLTTGVQKALKDSIQVNNVNNLVTNSTYNELNDTFTTKTEEEILHKYSLIDKITHTKTERLQSDNNQNRSSLKTNLEKTKSLVQPAREIINGSFLDNKAIQKVKSILFKITQKLQTRTDKNLEWWRKKERVITKRKNSRKRDRFKKQIAIVNKKLKAETSIEEKSGPNGETKKGNLYKTLYGNYEVSNYLLTDSSLLRKKEDKNLQKNFTENSSLWHVFFNKKLRKKVSSKGRRYRSLSLARYLTSTRKPRLVGVANLTKIDNITNLNGTFLNKEEKQERLKNILESPTGTLENALKYDIKTSQIKKRSRHSWKKRARQQFSRNHYKYRKRHIHGNGKLRVMNKKIKKFKATNELRQWWWSSFLPRYLNNLSSSKSIFGEINKTTAFKPLSNTNYNSSNVSNYLNSSSLDNTNSVEFKKGGLLPLTSVNQKSQINGVPANTPTQNQPLENINTTSLPFYAGWDESLRKFVITNRFLSRRDTGLSVSSTLFNTLQPNKDQTVSNDSTFTNAPIQGLNEGSFLYWQTEMPFNSYNIDQFIPTNQSFYAPLGWRRFEFQHNILKTWTTKANKISKVNQTLIVSIKNLNKNVNNNKILKENLKNKKAVARRIKKRYKLIKQMPNILMYSPTGPLLTEVLPSHYISVFDQQYRFPRNRYLKRNTLKTLKKTTLLSMVDNNTQQINNSINKEFTLRKRVKPRRKYHRKRFIKKDGLIFPRRMKFTTNTQSDSLLLNTEENTRWRPSSQSKQKRKETSRSKIKSNKRVKTNPLRLRQLRRREFQQILKPVQRYIPRNGGFTWPGDYLRLEIVSMPKLKLINVKKTSLKQKINVQPVGIMPRKYLIEKHNIKVLKKKLEKAYSTHNLIQTVEQYKQLLR